MRILIVEDEFILADIIASRLRKDNYIADIATDGEDGLYKALHGGYDLMILDVMLPYKDGFEILRELRMQNIETKVIMLTARSELEDKLNGFERGADDYITKPFKIEEVVARVNAQLRKHKANGEAEQLTVGDLCLDLKTSKIFCTKTNESIEISRKEFLLLEYLMRQPETIITKERLYMQAWGMDNDCESNSLEAYLSFIRKKLKAIDVNVIIKAVRGMGYRLEANSD